MRCAILHRTRSVVPMVSSLLLVSAIPSIPTVVSAEAQKSDVEDAPHWIGLDTTLRKPESVVSVSTVPTEGVDTRCVQTECSAGATVYGYEPLGMFLIVR